MPQNTSGIAAITSAFAAMSLTTSSGTSSSVFGDTTLSPITSRVSVGPAGNGGFVISMAAPHRISTTGSFIFVSGWSGRTGLKNPFWEALNTNSLGTAGQSTPSHIHVASTPQDTSGIAATTSGFGATTQTTSSGTSSSVFGSSTSSPFTSGVSAGPAHSWGFGMSMGAPHSSSTTGAFSFGEDRMGALVAWPLSGVT
ncbi:nuclear envelope pore membrane protein POM 121C-like [Manis javanica]|uniref:nuclear envelope pore membrane protein POM 121C-like n=1 Tax=Manis javanica TaxID=9974 RepID=UPI000812E318